MRNKNAQGVLEYVLILTAMLGVFLWLARPKSILDNAVNDSLGRVINATPNEIGGGNG